MALISTLVAACAGLGPIVDDFEAYQLGELPDGIWLDVNSRIDNPTVPSPTAVMVDTIGPDGAPTKAVQLVPALGTSQGVLAPITPAKTSVLRADVRIDQYSNAPNSWPGSISLLQDLGAPDLNIDPQAVVYAWQDQRWHLFVKNAGQGGPGGIDVVIGSAGIIEIGKWYTLELESDLVNGVFTARVYDATTGQFLGSRLLNMPNWDPAFGQFDAIAFFDGDGQGGGGFGSISSYDNVEYDGAVACAADVNGDGELDILDFVAFQSAFIAGDPGADCDGDGQFTVLDFICYQQLFVAGCG